MPGSAVGLVTKAHQVAAYPFVVEVRASNANHFLLNIGQPNLKTAPDAKALWATRAANAGEGTEFSGTAWVVSAEAYKRLKAHRF